VAIKQRVELLGVGAIVEVNPKGGGQLRGVIQSIGEQDFVLGPIGPSVVRHFAYDQVQRVSFTKLSYKAAGHPDPAQARRVVAGWGVGKAVRVTLADGRKLKGKIWSMDMEHFSLRADARARPVYIAYAELRQVQSGGTTSRTQWLILGSAVGGFIILAGLLGSAMSG
jgi:hypothetical protein